MTITISGTALEIIQFAKLLEAGMSPENAPPLPKEVMSLIYNRKIVEAIKYLRADRNIGLQEAKELVDAAILRVGR